MGSDTVSSRPLGRMSAHGWVAPAGWDFACRPVSYSVSRTCARGAEAAARAGQETSLYNMMPGTRRSSWIKPASEWRGDLPPTLPTEDSSPTAKLTSGVDRSTWVAGLLVFLGYYLGSKLGFALTFKPNPSRFSGRRIRFCSPRFCSRRCALVVCSALAPCPRTGSRKCKARSRCR